MRTALAFLVSVLSTAAADNPGEWPAYCRWPDRVLEDGRRINMRPLFNWIGETRTPPEKPRQGVRAAPVEQPQNPMPLWKLLNVEVKSSTTNETVVVDYAPKKTGEVAVGPSQRLRMDSISRAGGLQGQAGTRDVYQPPSRQAVYTNLAVPMVIKNYPGHGKVAEGGNGVRFYALLIGKTNISFQGESVEVDVYDHGKPVEAKP